MADCKGRIFRYHQNTYISKSGEIIVKDVFKPLKKLSCPGCEKCNGLIACLKDSLRDGAEIYREDELFNGDTVQLDTFNEISPLPEYPDEGWDFDIGFRKIKVQS